LVGLPWEKWSRKGKGKKGEGREGGKGRGERVRIPALCLFGKELIRRFIGRPPDGRIN